MKLIFLLSMALAAEPTVKETMKEAMQGVNIAQLSMQLANAQNELADRAKREAAKQYQDAQIEVVKHMTSACVLAGGKVADDCTYDLAKLTATKKADPSKETKK